MTLINSTILDPWGPIAGILFGLDSDGVQRIVELAGLTPDWTLDERQAFSHLTRKRAFRDRIEAKYSRLSDNQKRLFILNVARELCNQGYQERLKEILQNIGWLMIGDKLVQIDILNPSDFVSLPKASHDNFTKAAERLPSDPSGAVTSACGAIDSVCTSVYEMHPELGRIGKASFQEKVMEALKAVKALENLCVELKELGWDDKDAEIFCKNLKGSISQAAYVMQCLRSNMGDVHGDKPSLAILAFDSIKWAMIISSLLGGRRPKH